uniref:Uncharacterized protein n=1 Tax=Nelumbo nucifera TaxID=4432 RepID=A0A822YK94_NELNU|nr:TPA_asm: hypothetical protein HUJ06_031246 [Nelumbo nucifera]
MTEIKRTCHLSTLVLIETVTDGEKN